MPQGSGAHGLQIQHHLGRRVAFLRNIRNGFLEKITTGLDFAHLGFGCLGGCGQRKLKNSTLMEAIWYAVEQKLYYNGVAEKIRWVPPLGSRLFVEIRKSDLGITKV